MAQREFTIERQMRLAKGVSESHFASDEQAAETVMPEAEAGSLMAEVRALRGEVKALTESLANLPVDVEPQAKAEEPKDLQQEAQAAADAPLNEENEFLRREIARMVRSMAQAKEQIAAIKHPDVDDDQVNEASTELAAIVQTTENATNTILEMGEGVLEIVERLSSVMGNDEDVQNACSDISTRMNDMFEACNFQDITGQRVSKVVQTLSFIEERLRIIINVWGTEAFAEIPIPAKTQLHETDDLVNGPASDDSGLSQDEIDSLFG